MPPPRLWWPHIQSKKGRRGRRPEQPFIINQSWSLGGGGGGGVGVGRERGSFRIAWRLWGGGEDEGSQAKCRRAQVGDCWSSAQKTCTIKEKKKKTNFAYLLAFLLATFGAALPAHFALVLFFSALFLPVPPPLCIHAETHFRGSKRGVGKRRSLGRCMTPFTKGRTLARSLFLEGKRESVPFPLLLLFT